MSFLSILNKEYYLPNSVKIRLILSVGFGIIIFLILILFSPFGIQNIVTLAEKVIVALGYGFIAFLVWYLGLVLLKTTKANKGKLWQIFIALIIIQFFAGVFSMLYNNLIFKNPSYFDFFLQFQVIVFLMGIIPCFYLILFMETNYYHKIVTTESYISKKEVPIEDNLITIQDQNPEKNLTIPADNIMYIQSQDNYIKIVWKTSQEEVKSRMLRATLNSAITTLSNHDNIIQCHRSFLINLNFVGKVKGSTLTKKCIMHGSDSELPISRNKIQIVLDKLNSEYSNSSHFLSSRPKKLKL